MNKFLSASPLWLPSGIGIIRIIVGLLIVYHGWELFDPKLMKEYATWDAFKDDASPALMAYLGKGSELVAGILLTLGLLTRVACLIIIATFLYITFLVGHGKFWYEDQHPFMFVIVALMFFFTGPGNYNVDAFIFKRSRV